ncbi:MAG: alpha-L-fucosidase [Candidatus Fimenecus sp.]
MGYSLKQRDFDKAKHGGEFTYFSEEDWNSYPFASDEDTKWFREAKYGLFLHVGISAVGMVDISWPRNTKKLPDPSFWAGGVPDEEYDGWAKQLAFPKFNAKEWASLAKQSGFQYVVIIAKHHDGFHMWDTAYSDYKITNAPFGRDYLKELIDAFREAGLKIGVYYSKRDWTHPDYEAVPAEDAVAIKTAPFFKMKDGKEWYLTEKHKRYQEYMFNTIRELMTNYGRIDLLWWDAEYNGGMFTKEMWNSEELEKMVRELQPHIIINNRAGLPGDYDTPEGHTGFFQNTRMWETCMPLGKAWAHSKGNIKSEKQVIAQLINCTGGDGNYLLSIGCMPDGSIAENEAQRMKEVGAWLQKYGESVYKTNGGIWKPTKKYAACFKGNTVYLHILNGFPVQRFSLPFQNNTLKSCTCLTGEKVMVKAKNGKLHITVFGRKASAPDTILKIKLKSQPIMEN